MSSKPISSDEISSHAQYESSAVPQLEPSFLITAEKTKEAVARVPDNPAAPKNPENSSFSQKIDLLAGKTSKYAAVFDMQDTTQSAMRNTANLVQYFVGSNALVGKVTALDGAVCSFAYMIVRGLTFRTALQKLPSAWKYGDWYDKLDSILTLFRTFLGAFSSGLSSAKNIGTLACWTALALPATIVSIMVLTVWSLKAIATMGRLVVSYVKMNQAMSEGASDKEKITSLVNYFDEVEKTLERENDALRGEEYVRLKAELELTSDLSQREQLTKSLENIKDQNPEREVFLKARTLARITAKYGSQGIKRIAEYKNIKAELERFDQLRAEVEDGLDDYGQNIDRINRLEAAYLLKSKGWFREVKEALFDGLVIQAIMLSACMLGIAGGIMGLCSPSILVPISCGISIFGSVLWLIFDARNWQLQNLVTDNQKQWVKELLVNYFEDSFVNAENVKDISHFFLDKSELRRIESLNEQEKANFTRHRLKHLLLQSQKASDLINSSFVDYLKLHKENKLTEKEKKYLADHICQTILSLGKDEAYAQKVKEKIKLKKFINERLLHDDQQKRLGALHGNVNYELAQLSKELQAFADDYSRQLFSTIPTIAPAG